ncbi:MAG TPA: Qat anti-phage system QueC-like protein QatC [Polyangiaceae bacterium]
MKWHVTLRVGPDDDFVSDVGPETPRLSVSLDRSGDPGLVQQHVLKEILAKTGGVSPAPAEDLLAVAMGVYAVDTRIPRATADDGWTREIILQVPVFDTATWNAMSPLLCRALDFLTGDSWAFEFRERRPRPLSDEPAKKTLVDAADVELFSGGLDSLAGAIDLLESGRTVVLAGHYGAGVTNSVQQNVLSALQAHYGERVVACMFHVQPLKAADAEGEQSMRSRSLLFLSLGVAVATALGQGRTLTVCENGLISLNVPLTNPRIGSWSTRTTHPHFIALFRQLLAGLGLDVAVKLPARFETKGELLSRVPNQGLLRTIAPLSMSCSHPEQGRFRKVTPGNHCGYCVPCIVRRASTAAASLADAAYDVDVLSPDAALTVETRKDLRAFEIAMRRLRDAKPSHALFDVLSTGPLPPEDVAEYAAVYRRGMEEVARFLTPGN